MIRLLAIALLYALDQRTTVLVEQITLSGQAVELATPPSERLAPPGLIAPGAPPLLGFKVMEGKLRHRFGDLDLVMDDAGH